MFLIRDGKLVRRTGPREYRVLEPATDPVKIVKSALPPEELVYIWDVDGVEAGAPNHEFYQRLERNRIPPWIDAGCRTPEDAMDAFFAGAEVLTVRLEHMSEAHLADFADLAEYEFHLSLPFSGAQPDVPLSAWDVRRLVGEMHAHGVVFEAGPGTDPRAYARFVDLVQNGGIDMSFLSTEHLPWLRDLAQERGAKRVIEPWRPPR